MPSPMARTEVDCIACHRHQEVPSETAEVIGQTFTAIEDSCRYCHGAKYTGALERWRHDLAELETKVETACQETRQRVTASEVSTAVRRRAELLLADADHNRRLVALGHGVHNFNYSLALLNAALDFCRKADIALETAPAKDRKTPD